MAENKVTIYEFVAWCMQQIPADELSALMSAYQQTDDSAETIVEMLQYEDFKRDFGTMLGESIVANSQEINRAIGGVKVNDEALTLNDWMQIAETHEFTLATGVSTASTAKKSWDWEGITKTVLGIAGTVAGGIFGGAAAGQQQNQNDNSTKDAAKSSNTVLYIVVGVVVFVVAAILVVSFARKK